ncbi:MAG: M12 family metallo-peptidase [Pseudomonadota bacterium]|uniref:M12 family metallo-peptidase n=1 Tax=Acidovorax facilis TaxID=12917 RepID=UPI0033573E9F
MKNKTMFDKLSWRFTKSLAVAAFAFYLVGAHAQQIMELTPGEAPSEKLALTAMSIKPGEALHIQNLKINDELPSVVNLILRRSEVINGDTQFIVVDEKGSRAFPLAASAHFVGVLEGNSDSYAFVTVNPSGEIRTIIHRGKETVVNELLPARGGGSGGAVSRLVDHQKDFVNREFSCGVSPEFLQSDPGQRKLGIENLLKTGRENSQKILGEEKAGSPRRADIIIDSDYEFYQNFGSESAAFTYVTDLLTYVGSRYQAEVATRFNLKQIVIRTTSADPWTQTATSAMLDELRTFWNAGANASISRHHVHLLSGKNSGGGIAYVGSLSNQAIAYGVSANIEGNFNPSNPQVIWDSVVVAHEIGHAFGSSHTHDYDNPYIAPTPNTGGAIDCCYSGNSTGQCGIALGGAGRFGFLPGLSSTTGGGAGQGNGTIMSYCHLLSGGMSNIAWTFGTNHAYGVNAGRVPTVMSDQAQTKLPLDTSGTFDLSVSKTGTGTVTSSPAGINCGVDCNESYAAGTVVTLSAVVGTGYTFSGWGGDCSGTGSCTVTMSAARNVTATFIPTPQGVLSVAKIGTGTGTVSRTGGLLNCGSTCSESLTPGTIATLTASPSAGSAFVGWSGGACSGTGACSFTVNANTTVTANFKSNNAGGPATTPLLETNLTGAAGSVLYRTVTIPAGAKNLIVQISGGIGDVDLFVKFGQVPTTIEYDCRPYLPGNEESCTFPTPAAGTYHVMLRGYSQYSGVTLAASYHKKPINLAPILQLLLD